MHVPAPCRVKVNSIENQSWFSFVCCNVFVMNSMVDCNEMSIAANPPFFCNLGPVKTCQLARTLTTNYPVWYWCKLINALDQMGPFHILLDEMGLDQMGLDKVGRPQTDRPTGTEAE